MDEAVVRPHPEPWNKGKLVGQKAVLPIGGRPGCSLPRPSRNSSRFGTGRTK
jgi:hypothetical protein